MIDAFIPIERNIEIIWELSHKCNYDCWYCYIKKFPNTYDMYPVLKSFSGWNMFNMLFNNLMIFKEKEPNFKTLSISGGEPSIHPHFNEWIEYLSNNIKSDMVIDVLSNGTQPTKKFLNLINKIYTNKNVKFCFSMSYFLDEVNKKEIVDKINILKKYELEYRVKVVPEPWNFESFKKSVNFMLKHNLKFYVKLLYGDDIKYSDEQIKYINSLNFGSFDENLYIIKNDNIINTTRNELEFKKINYYKNYWCYKRFMLRLNPLGFITSMCAEHIKESPILLIEKNIDEIISSIYEPIQCVWEGPCPCYNIPKYLKNKDLIWKNI